MPSHTPPTLDPVAARHWSETAPQRSPWLHDEVARRMEERLQWIRLSPQAWANWDPVRGGLAAHAAIAQRYPSAQAWLVDESGSPAIEAALARPWWRRWGAPVARRGEPPEGSVQMVWANMQLHMSAQPQELMSRWHRALQPQGFLMFSCLGPDTLRELRALYRALGWPPPAHDFTDMHDWGDMLVHAGFAEPVMDMERITLTWPGPQRLVEELRDLGANLNRERFGALRGRGWRHRLDAELARGLAQADGRLALTFEVIYGHALKPAPVVRMSGQSAVSLEDMRSLLREGRGPRHE